MPNFQNLAELQNHKKTLRQSLWKDRKIETHLKTEEKIARLESLKEQTKSETVKKRIQIQIDTLNDVLIRLNVFKQDHGGSLSKAKDILSKDRINFQKQEKQRLIRDEENRLANKEQREKEMFAESYDIFLGIGTLRQSLKEIEKEYEIALKEGDTQDLNDLETEKGDVKTRLQTLENDNHIESRAVFLQSLVQDLNKPGHISQTPSVRADVDWVKSKITQGVPVFLSGPTGTGKTSTAVFASTEMTGQSPHVVACGPQTRETNIWGKMGINVKDAASFTEFVNGPLTNALTNGTGIVFDEFNLLEPGQQDFIKAMLSAKVGDPVNIPGNGTVIKSAGFHIIFTANLKSEKHESRNKIEAQICGEFGKREIVYQKAEETYDIFLSWIMNRLSDKQEVVTFSKYDLGYYDKKNSKPVGTLPVLTLAFRKIQDMYNGKITDQDIQDFNLKSNDGKVTSGLKNLILGFRQLDRILKQYIYEKQRNMDTSFVKVIDQELLSEMFGKEKSDKEDHVLTLTILASYGFLRTLTDADWEKLNLSSTDLKKIQDFTKKQVFDPSLSAKTDRLNLKDLAELDPFNKRQRKTANVVGEVMDGDGNVLEPIIPKVVEKNNSQNNSEVRKGNVKSDAWVEEENEYLRDTAKNNWNQDLVRKPVQRNLLNTFNFADPALLTANASKAGEIYTLDQSLPPGVNNKQELNSFFENTKPTIFNPNTDKAFKSWLEIHRQTTDATGNIKKYEVMTYVSSVLSKDNYIPGLEYNEWILKNPNHANMGDALQKTGIHDGNYYYTSGSLFRNSSGASGVPLVYRIGSSLAPFVSWLVDGVRSNGRLLLLSL